MASTGSPRLTTHDLGYTPGSLKVGPTDSILDVPGLHISQLTVPTTTSLKEGSTATKGITVISPRPPNEFYKPCNAGTFCFNGNGELTGSRQVADWGFINTPIAFTNSISLGTVFDGAWDFVMDQQDKLGWDSLTRSRHYGTPVVGETADWIVNSDVRSSRLAPEDVKKVFANLKSKEDGAQVQEGQKGGGAGMTCHMYAGGTGTSSRLVGGGVEGSKEYTLGTNYGLLVDLVIGGVPIGKILAKENETKNPEAQEADGEVHAPTSSEFADTEGRSKDGSILVLIVTDAPLSSPQLSRVARHATAGLTLAGSYSVGRNFSGDIFLAVSTAEHGSEQLESFQRTRLRHTETYWTEAVKNESIDAYFQAAKEGVEEAVLNSLLGGRDGTVCMDGTKIAGLPTQRVTELLAKHLVKF